jgi:hypothetical protein
MDRNEHLAWAKTRALPYLDAGDTTNAIASFVSDLGKHPDTQDHVVKGLIAMHIAAGLTDDRTVRGLIEGTR